MNPIAGFAAAIALVAFVLANLAAFFTHMIYSFSAVVADNADNVMQAFLTLVIGVLIPFLGVIHGWMIWFGAGIF